MNKRIFREDEAPLRKDWDHSNQCEICFLGNGSVRQKQETWDAANRPLSFGTRRHERQRRTTCSAGSRAGKWLSVSALVVLRSQPPLAT